MLDINKTTEELLNNIMDLNPKERAFIVEKLLESLDKPDQNIDMLWQQEAEQRIDAYQQGHLKTLTVEEVFFKYIKKD
jgi:putative addiction module component (TIGR02574 family)